MGWDLGCSAPGSILDPLWEAMFIPRMSGENQFPAFRAGSWISQGILGAPIHLRELGLCS